MLVGLIVKTETNPFFVKMKESALGRARTLGVELHTFSHDSIPCYPSSWAT